MKITEEEKVLYDWLQGWKKKKEQYREDYGSGWPAKLVTTEFLFAGNRYRITPEDLDLDKDPVDIGFMEYLQTVMRKELEELGARDIRQSGFLD